MNLNDLIKKQKEQSSGKPRTSAATNVSDSSGKADPSGGVHSDAAAGGGTGERVESDQRAPAVAQPTPGRLNFGIANRQQNVQPAADDSAGAPDSESADSGVQGDPEPLTHGANPSGGGEAGALDGKGKNQANPATPKSPVVGGLAGLLKKPLTATPVTMEQAQIPSKNLPSNQDGSFSLADLDAFEAEAAPDPLKIYEDMIPVDLPDRPLPDDLTEQQMSFVELVESTYHVLNEPEAFGQVIRNLMSELAENPEYDKLIVDADINAMMRGMRQTMGLAQVKKASNKRGAKSKAPSEKALKLSVGSEELDNMFGEGAFDD